MDNQTQNRLDMYYRNSYAKIGLTVAMLLCLQSLTAQQLDTLKLTNRQPVLNGRAFFYIPASAKVEARTANIMAADYNNNEETRFVMDIGKMRLVLFAKEVYLLADANFQNTIETSNQSIGFNTKVLANKDSLFSILSTPTKFDNTKQAILVNNLLVRTQDNTLFRIDAFINPDAFELKDEFQQLTEKIFSSLAKGDRINQLNERTEVLPTVNETVNLSFKVPANYCITIDKKYDFQVYKFHKFRTFAEASDFEDLIIYTGFHPSEIYKDLGLTENDAIKTSGKLLGQNIEWLQFDARSEGVLVKEQKVVENRIQPGLIVHVAIISNQQKNIEALTKIVESIRLAE